MSGIVMKYDLMQVTPMIHFQADESGATLRASEVKPKLDAFITKRVKNIDDNWLIEKDKSALNYKMKIIANGNPIIEENINKMYFGNMGKDCVKKKTIFYSEKIKLEIVCFIEELRKQIDASIIDFFLNTNFGTRQSKGFGSFLCKKAEDDGYLNWSEIKNSNHYGSKNLIWADFSKNKSIDYAMNNAAMVYAIMKSGINMSKKKKEWDFAFRYCLYNGIIAIPEDMEKYISSKADFNDDKKETSLKKEKEEIKNIRSKTIEDKKKLAVIEEILNCIYQLKNCKSIVEEIVSTENLGNYINDNKNSKNFKIKSKVKTAESWKALLKLLNTVDGKEFDEKVKNALANESTYFYDQNRYIKGFLNAGAGTNVRGDKAFIKLQDSLWRDNGEVGRRKIEENDNSDGQDINYAFLRILLGMADHYEFKDPDRRRIGTVYVRNFNGITIEEGKICGEEELKENIVRFKSPITMKIYEEGIIFIFDQIPDELLGKWFYISKNKEAETDKKELKVDSFIKTPDCWDWTTFIKEFNSYYEKYKTNIKALLYLFEGAEYIEMNIMKRS